MIAHQKEQLNLKHHTYKFNDSTRQKIQIQK